MSILRLHLKTMTIYITVQNSSNYKDLLTSSCQMMHAYGQKSGRRCLSTEQTSLIETLLSLLDSLMAELLIIVQKYGEII